MTEVSRLAETIGGLREHFDALHKARLEIAPAPPVFALEHPLDQADVHVLAKDLRDALSSGRRVALEHALAWVVIASETGYGFGGCEFWQSFEERIPNWAELGDRDALRRAFMHFCKLYQGARPVGQWASHYTLICWPITHAILPRDLQARLCEAIYACRYHLAGMSDASAENIGLIMDRATPSFGTRFDQFLQEHALVGAIVSRLLRGESDITHSFRSETFDRILNDLHRISATQEWLREARRLHNRKVTISSPHAPARDGKGDPSARRRQLFDLRPTLVLEVDGSGVWGPSVIPPSLLPWTQESAELGRLIETLRYRVIGTDRARQGACLLATTPLPTVLPTLPPLNQPLIELLPHHEWLSAAFDAECRLPASDLLVFHERSGVATLSRNTEVHPGETYLIATQNPTLELGEPASCLDPTWRLRRLQLPSPLTATLSAQLSAAGIHARRATRLRPWGLLPRNWDDENSGEWIVTEPIVYAIERDHLFDAISFCVNGDKPVFLECDEMADPAILITDLPVGAHNLSVQTYERRNARSGPELHELSRGEICVRVRAPSVWIPDRIANNILSIEVVPQRPSLEDLLKGKVTLTVDGVASAPVEISVQWTDGPNLSTSCASILRQRAPIHKEAWSEGLGAFLRKIDSARISLGVRQAHLRVECEPLGEQLIPISVAASPVRWSVRDKLVRLICDGSHIPQIVMSTFAAPVTATQFERRVCERGLEQTRSGLYFAIDGDLCSGVVLGSPGDPAGGLRAIGEQIDFHTLRSCEAHDLQKAIERWEVATPLNVYARANQQRVVTQLHTEVLRRLTGDYWTKLESSHPRRWSDLEEAVDYPLTVHSFGYSLGRHRGRADDPDALRRNFLEAATAYTSIHDATYLDMAWQFATRPYASLAHTSPATIDHVLARLVRGARLIWLGNNP